MTTNRALVVIGLLGAAHAGASCAGDTGVAGPGIAIEVAIKAESNGGSAAEAVTRSRIDDVQRRFRRGAWTPFPPSDARDGARRLTATDLHIDLPERASGAVQIEEPSTGLGVACSLRNARDRSARFADGIAVYDAATADGASLFRGLTRGGTEDFVLFETRPAREEIVLDLATTRVAGLRLVAGTLELLDAAGTPRLRMAPPFLIDAAGEEHEAVVSVRGCAFDESPLGPWGRSPTPPCADAEQGGTCQCELVIAWDGADIRYPALLDPQWMSTGMMASVRKYATATALPDQRVLVVGGEDPMGTELKSTEFYHPATKTWAMGPILPVARTQHAAALLSDGRVLIVGGRIGVVPYASSSLLEPVNGTKWTNAGLMTDARQLLTVTALPNGRALVAGGAGFGVRFDTAELLVSPGSWISAGKMSSPRDMHTATLLPNGDVLVVGGYDVAPIAGTDVYTPSSNTWKAGPTLIAPRYEHSASFVGTGAAARVLVVGGRNNDAGALATTELLDLGGTWQPGPSLATARGAHQAVTLVNGSVLVTGGYGKSSIKVLMTELLSLPGARTDAGALNDERFYHVAALLPDGAVLVAGGASVPSAEVWQLVAQSALCTTPGECLSGSCVGGVCCDKPCSGACNACTAAETGLSDGICGPRTMVDCKGFVCDPVSGDCLVACSKQDDCAAGDACGADGKCSPDLGKCDGNHTVVKQHDPSIDCGAYRCDATTNLCLLQCTSSADCAEGFACPVNACVPEEPIAPPADPGACACHQATAPASGYGALVVAVSALLGLVRRRRPRRGAPPAPRPLAARR